MKLSKEQLKKLILESFQEQQFDGGKRVYPPGMGQTQNPPVEPVKTDTKQMMKQNISQQIRILKFMQETIKQIKAPNELQNMIAQVQKSKTPDFLKQVLGVDETIPIKVSSVLENPMELLQAIIGQIIKVATEKGNKKLQEGIITEEDLKYLMRDPDARLQKHKAKIKKMNPPAPKLTEGWDNTSALGKEIYEIMKSFNVKNVSRQGDPKNIFRIGYFNAMSGAEVFAEEVEKLLPGSSIKVKQLKNESGKKYIIVMITLSNKV